MSVCVQQKNTGLISLLQLRLTSDLRQFSSAPRNNLPMNWPSPQPESTTLLNGVYCAVIAQFVVFGGLAMLCVGFDAKTTAVVCLACSVAAMLAVTMSERKRVEWDDNNRPRPRWERRWAKTELRKQKRKDIKVKVWESRKREIIESQARERSRRLREATERRTKADDERRRRDWAKDDKRRAAEVARRSLELARQRDREEQRCRKLAAKKEECERKRQEALIERRRVVGHCLQNLDATIASAVALEAIAKRAEVQRQGALDAVAETPNKRRSNKSKSSVKKLRDRAAEYKQLAIAARAVADAAYDDAHSARHNCIALTDADPALRHLKPPPLPTLNQQQLLETPAEIRRIIDHVRQTIQHHHPACSEPSSRTFAAEPCCNRQDPRLY